MCVGCTEYGAIPLFGAAPKQKQKTKKQNLNIKQEKSIEKNV